MTRRIYNSTMMVLLGTLLVLMVKKLENGYIPCKGSQVSCPINN